MPSKILGRSRPSAPQRSRSPHDDAPKQARSRAHSDKFNRDIQQNALKSPGGPPTSDRGTADSYFNAVKRRTGASTNIDLNETDDFGYPFSSLAMSPGEIETSARPSQQTVKAKCRVCDADVQLPIDGSDQCGQCSAFNTNESVQSQSSQLRVISLPRARFIIERCVSEGLRKLSTSLVADSANAGSDKELQRMQFVSPSKNSSFSLPRQGFLGQRRGSAPEKPHLSPRSRSPQKLRTTANISKHNAKPKLKPMPVDIHATTIPMENRSPGLLSASTPLLDNSPKWTQGESSPPKGKGDTAYNRAEQLRDGFRPIFELMAASFQRDVLNTAFSTLRHQPAPLPGSKLVNELSSAQSPIDRLTTPPPQLAQMDHKNLMIGDVYDVASSLVTDTTSPVKKQITNVDGIKTRIVSQNSAHIDWSYLNQWYRLLVGIGLPLTSMTKAEAEHEKYKTKTNYEVLKQRLLEDLGFEIRATMLTLMEQVLLLPQSQPERPEDIRYLLVMLACPLFLHQDQYPIRFLRRSRSAMQLMTASSRTKAGQTNRSKRPINVIGNRTTQSRVLSLILGTLSNVSSECLGYATHWLVRYPDNEFRNHVDILLHVISTRLSLRRMRSGSVPEKKSSTTHHGVATSQMFDDILQSQFDSVNNDNAHDWRLKSSCSILQMFARANDHFVERNVSQTRHGNSLIRKKPVTKQLIETEHFYMSLLDDKTRFDPRRDFDDWEKKAPGLQLTQYPFLLSLGTKIKILEFDARRKMETRARQEFFDSVMRHTAVDKTFHLSVRRHCVVEDSLQRISEAVNSSEGEAKKALKVHFDGEDGVDAGGPRKEWFLLLMKELLDPDIGLFIYNEETNYCYFNPLSFESTEQYQLVGAVLGLAIYNFTILDVPFPPFLFRKLVAAAPQIKGYDLHQGWKPAWKPDISDLAQYDPVLARNLQYILEHEGDLAEEICATFDVEISHHGVLQKSSLHSGEGEKIVDKDNRAEYVRQYVDFILDKSIRKQFEAFARGFFNVCWGNALSLFRGEEIELLIRGSSDLDFSVLRGCTVYENWKLDDEGEELTSATAVEDAFPIVRWFWELMNHADVDDQKRVLRWITGSDRVPATGIGSLSLKIQRLGDDSERLPQCRTCFNTLQLWNYKSRRTFVNKFWYAVIQSGQGFGLK